MFRARQKGIAGTSQVSTAQTHHHTVAEPSDQPVRQTFVPWTIIDQFGLVCCAWLCLALCLLLLRPRSSSISQKKLAPGHISAMSEAHCTPWFSLLVQSTAITDPKRTIQPNEASTFLNTGWMSKPESISRNDQVMPCYFKGNLVSSERIVCSSCIISGWYRFRSGCLAKLPQKTCQWCFSSTVW